MLAAPSPASAGLLSGLFAAPKATATPKPTATPKATPKPTATPKATATPKPTATPKATPAPTPTPAPTIADLSLVASTSTAKPTCNEPKVFKPFKAFGDTADYSFAPGGTFESGTAGWSLSGASVVSGNDTSGVYGGSKSLRIADGGRVVSPWFCVSEDHPTFRYTTKGGEVEMEIDYIIIGDDDVDDSLTGETNGGSSWAPSQIHGLANEIPAHKLAKGVLARLIWEAEDDIVIDNVLVDPYRRG
ncbi:MAG: hypothetical protein J7513_14245 [Solirubrobacteraceae bacterium]|nr:hypothetical protein [Solirubrobacteraceae bacterium]